MKLSNWVAKVGVVILPTALVSFPPSPAWASNQFALCVQVMINNGVVADQAATACADALIPKELSKCVKMLRSKTAIEAESALQACYQVRRPIDLANCVVDINRILPKDSVKPATSKTEEKSENQLMSQKSNINEPVLVAQAETIIDENSSPLLTALDSCRRSLLPGRYSECVRGLERRASLQAVEAMDTCLKVQDLPSNIFPVYQP